MKIKTLNLSNPVLQSFIELFNFNSALNFEKKHPIIMYDHSGVSNLYHQHSSKYYQLFYKWYLIARTFFDQMYQNLDFREFFQQVLLFSWIISNSSSSIISCSFTSKYHISEDLNFSLMLNHSFLILLCLSLQFFCTFSKFNLSFQVLHLFISHLKFGLPKLKGCLNLHLDVHIPIFGISIYYSCTPNTFIIN